MKTADKRDHYWAAAPMSDLPDIVEEMSREYWRACEARGLILLWRRLERSYYGLDEQGSWTQSAAVTFAGDAGEQVMLRVNEFRSIVRGVASLVTAERPAFEARATSSNAASIDAAPLCEGLVSAYYENGGVEDAALDASRHAILLGEGYTHLRWDAFAGAVHTMGQRPVYRDGEPVMEEREAESIDPVTGIPSMQVESVPVTEEFPERAGDIVPSAHSPIEVIHDLDAMTLQWAIVPHDEDVWTLAARYPDLRERILRLRGSVRWPRRVWDPIDVVGTRQRQDTVTVWSVYHLQSDAVPMGRHALVVGDLVLYDGPLTMRTLPIVPLIPERQSGTGTGDTPLADLLCLQELYDMVWSSLITPIDALAVQNIAVPDGQDIKAENLTRGLQMLRYQPNPMAKDNGLPIPLQLLQTPEELWKLLSEIPAAMQRLSGINSVMRGDPDSQIKSGNYAALIAAQAQSYNGPLARGIIRHHEMVGGTILETLRCNATTKRIAEIGGNDRQTAVREFVGSDLTIERVSLDMANPLSRSTAGRLEIAQMLLSQPGMIQTPTQLLQLLASGRIDPMYRAQQSELTLIRRENEAISSGKAPLVALTDSHALHLAEHAACIADPTIRESRPDVMKAALEHMMEHGAQATQLFTTAPWLAFATGQKLPPELLMQGQGGPPPGQPQGGPPPGGEIQDAAMRANEPGRAKAPGAPPGADMPFMPTNPQTGQRETPPGAMQ